MRRTATALLALSAVLGLAGCGSSDMDQDTAANPSSSMAPTSSATPTRSSPTSAGPSVASPTGDAMAAGAYLTLAEYKSQMGSRESSKVVYFFHASWCHDCRTTEKSISDDGVPAGLTVVKVDYDKETDLKKKYGVTVQHTFVQIAPDGEQLAKWSGSKSGAAIKSKTI
ncbi:thioredoxin family protein [Knoellia sp. S7-12]|uniref:thioredoxin family protein n=1 Tax=Knoellia sp. S7-12 TaxID=3126698 RepID=UPI0033671A5C